MLCFHCASAEFCDATAEVTFVPYLEIDLGQCRDE